MNEEARKRALRLLDKRDYSRKMLIDKLTEKDVSPEDAADVADWLCEIGVVDDRRYAGLVVRHYAGKGYGERRIREELYRRGIDPELRDDVLSELPDADDTVYSLLINKLRGSSAPEDLRRAQDALLRRGFSRSQVRAAVEHFLTKTEDEE